MISKKEIRKEILKQRKSLNNHDFITKSSLISDKIINHDVYKKSRVIYCYSSINNEVNLDLLMEDVVRQKKILALPKVEEQNLVFYEIDDFEKLEKGYFDILEPVDCSVAPSADLIIVPGVAFTNSGNRLGYGGGFYDRYLKENVAYTIGVAFDFQIKDQLPTEDHDIMLNEIIYA